MSLVEATRPSNEDVVACRLCGSSTRPLGHGADVALFRCRQCRFVTGVPQNSQPSDGYYAGYHAATAPPDPVARYEEWLRFAEARVGRGRLLEIGAGRGGFVRAALGRNWSAHATELSQVGLRALRALGATAFGGDIVDARYPDGHFDLVVSLEVLEHLPAPLKHLREVCRVTRPGGLLLLTTPNFGGLSRRMFGLRWRAVAGEHLGYFEPRTLAAALRNVGYARADVRSRSLDLSTWRAGSPSATFDEHASARLRDAVEGRTTLRLAKGLVNTLLGLTGLGDSLLVWASSPSPTGERPAL
jgi:SAM-dependent methyltransferase